MTNDTSTLSGSLDEMKDQLIDELDNKGVTATFDSSTGLLGLISKIGDIQQGGTSCPKLVQGTFTTGSTGGSTGSVSINYSGTGYPIACLVYVNGGAQNTTSGGNTTWVNSTSRYDVGIYAMIKAETNTTPTYATDSSISANWSTPVIVYKNSTSDSTSYTRTSNMKAVTYNSSNASTTYNCVRFKGNAKTLSYYVGNRASNAIGLARSTEFAYIIIYSE